LARSRAPQKLPKKEFELSEQSEFSNSRLLRGAQGSPQDQVTRVPFLSPFHCWFVFFGQAKKMIILYQVVKTLMI
jgi:hypothetical protein